MIRVTIEIVPLGVEKDAHEAETVYIWNDATGGEQHAHYGVLVGQDPRECESTDGQFWHNRSEGLLVCVRKALEAL